MKTADMSGELSGSFELYRTGAKQMALFVGVYIYMCLFHYKMQ